MVDQLVTTLFGHLTNMQMTQFFIVLFNQYIPYGIFFWGLGIVVLIISHMKTRNLAYSALIMCFFFVAMSYTPFITNIYSQMMMRWFGLIVGIICGFYIYRGIRG